MQTKLGMISFQLESDPGAIFDPEIEKTALEIWEILEDMCSWSRPFNTTYGLIRQGKQPFTSLLRLVEDESHHETLRNNIMSYLRQPFVVEGLIAKCEELSTKLQTDDSEEVIEIPCPPDHCRAHKELFHMLSEYTVCESCHSNSGPKEPASSHPTRLYLTGPTKSEDDLVGFDIIVSSVDSKSWQDLCIKVSTLTKKRVGFASNNEKIDQGACQLTHTTEREQLQRFCDIFQADDGCRLTFELENKVLFRLDAEMLKHRASSGKGLSLADVLQQYTLKVEEKLALAYIISSAFWQFYDSQIMNRAWNSHNIWFMPQPDLHDDSELLPLKAYISFDPEASECDFDASEFTETAALVHRCPRIQALARLLLEIGLGRHFAQRTFDRRTRLLNFRYSEAAQYLEELKGVKWENFAHKYIFTDAVEQCLKFEGLMGKGELSRIKDPHILRRQLLHEKVVSRLQWLSRAFRGSSDRIRYLSTKQLANDSGQINGHSLSPVDQKKSSNPEQRIRPRSRHEFDIGILCALTIEADAVEALFDHNWDDGPSYDKASGDPNAYSTGSIGRHNVVLTHMPGMGKGSAATVAAHCFNSFPNIKLAIVVGICGVVPFAPESGDEIILGDVIVSEGIVQYDLGRRWPEHFARKDTPRESLGRPHAEIRSILAKLKGNRNKNGLRNEMVSHLDKLQNESDLKAEYPGPQNDRLFEASYRHIQDNLTCQDGGCRGQLVRRRRFIQGATQPAIHFGLMASGDTVMKSGEDRDSIAKRENILAFEMEGAGVWETFPRCLVIKGACDYADSHKTKIWQQYAAATAAACTKAFLRHWMPSTASSK
ncbi:hypothetical protein BKA56DRAFT_619914 [Ilyonectria sp. MPI-CAGE-AT-0026]|nr:hypothetical protein BKA56DRAFT_619914 [Ilyonectria sp. MPI-CAGE-AT-0026]